jgi:hypothetical protein
MIGAIVGEDRAARALPALSETMATIAAHATNKVIFMFLRQVAC